MKLDQFTSGYIDAMLFAETDFSDESGGEPLDRNYSVDDFDLDSLKKIVVDCENFQEQNIDDIMQVPDWKGRADSSGRDSYSGLESAGHDFYFTRQGHGTGFWDRGYDKDLMSRLTKASKSFGEMYVYVGDDNKLYVG